MVLNLQLNPATFTLRRFFFVLGLIKLNSMKTITHIKQ